MWTQERLQNDLRRLGIHPGDLLFMHSSFKSLGTVRGGVATLIRALEAAVGPGGMILLPSFNLRNTLALRRDWNLSSTRSTVGWITEYFRNLPGTVRSDHYSHSVAARGPGAAVFVGDHRSSHGLVSPWDLEPWGRTYGTHSPMYRAYQRRGKLLMLGVDYESSTYCHLVESMVWSDSGHSMLTCLSPISTGQHSALSGMDWVECDEVRWARPAVACSASRTSSAHSLPKSSPIPRRTC